MARFRVMPETSTAASPRRLADFLRERKHEILEDWETIVRRMQVAQRPARGGKTAEATQPAGFGLYIVQQIVAAHGGTVAVHSTEAQGTTFSVRWPRKT